MKRMYILWLLVDDDEFNIYLLLLASPILDEAYIMVIIDVESSPIILWMYGDNMMALWFKRLIWLFLYVQKTCYIKSRGCLLICCCYN